MQKARDIPGISVKIVCLLWRHRRHMAGKYRWIKEVQLAATRRLKTVQILQPAVNRAGRTNREPASSSTQHDATQRALVIKWHSHSCNTLQHFQRSPHLIWLQLKRPLQQKQRITGSKKQTNKKNAVQWFWSMGSQTHHIEWRWQKHSNFDK